MSRDCAKFIKKERKERKGRRGPRFKDMMKKREYVPAPGESIFGGWTDKAVDDGRPKPAVT